MKKWLTPKGGYGYIDNRRKMTIVRTVIYFAICIGLYVMGYLTTGTNKNLLTIVAILGCLPSCKSLVNVIIFFRAKGCTETLHQQILQLDITLEGFYDMYFTSYQKNYDLSHLVIKGNVLCAVTEQPKCDCNEGQKHLEQMMAQEGIKGVTVKIFAEPSKYLDRLKQLDKLECEQSVYYEDLVRMLVSISL